MACEFDFGKFGKSLEHLWPTVDTTFSFEDTLSVFSNYFSAYESAFGRPHPDITAAQIVRIAEAMPHVDPDGALEVTADDYRRMITKHFLTAYRRGCDYSVSHFFSGKIRLLRFFEVCVK